MAVVQHKSADKTVATIPARNAISPRPDHMTVVVLDALGDPQVLGGRAIYKWSETTTAWLLLAKDNIDTLQFTSEAKTISTDCVAASNIPANGVIWDVFVLLDDASKTIAQVEWAVSAADITILPDMPGQFDGKTLYYTYAYGTVTQQIKVLLDQKADSDLGNVGSLPAAIAEQLKGAQGPQGPAGSDGAIGPQGPAGPSASLGVVEYDSRGSLRGMTPSAGQHITVDGLGIFGWSAGSTEPDDDESCFATASGCWLLQAVHWDLVDAWQAPDDASRDEYDEDEPLRFASNFAGKVLTGKATCAITSIAATSSASFMGAVTGAVVGDRVIATPPAQLGSSAAETGKLSYHAWVSAANTVTVVLANASASAASTNAAVQTAWPITVIKS